MKAQHIRLTGLRTKTAPAVEISDEGVYVWFKRGETAHKTVVKQRWPVVAVDYDKKGDVIGVEMAPFPKSFSINAILEPAGLRVSERMAANAEIVPMGKARQPAEAVAA